jgi:membrane-associated phospholipid phosphatase
MGLVLNGGTDLLIACTSIGMWCSSRAGAKLRAISFLSLLVPAYVLARLLQHLIARPRPFVAIPLFFRPEQDWWLRESNLFLGKGSMPSDHALLFALLIWAACGVHRRLGYAVGAYAAVYFVFRVGAGYHWPTDILAGGLLGFGLVVLMKPLGFRFSNYIQSAIKTLEAHQALTSVVGFLFLFEFAQGFKHIRFVAERALNLHLFH